MIVLPLAAAAAAFTCGAVSRPGIADYGADGVWRGAAVDACRTLAEGAPIAFHGYDDRPGLMAAARDRVAFVSAAEADAAALVAGPAIATGRQVLIVRPASPIVRTDQLAGRVVCFIVGTRAEDALTDATVSRLGFQEPDEMADGFASGKCAALAVDAADAVEPEHRTLAPPLAATPIIAATPPGDPAWTRRVAALLAGRQAKMSASRPAAGPSRASRKST